MRAVIKEEKVYTDGSKIGIGGMVYTQRWSHTFNRVKNANETRPNWRNPYIPFKLHYYGKK